MKLKRNVTRTVDSISRRGGTADHSELQDEEERDCVGDELHVDAGAVH